MPVWVACDRAGHIIGPAPDAFYEECGTCLQQSATLLPLAVYLPATDTWHTPKGVR